MFLPAVLRYAAILSTALFLNFPSSKGDLPLPYVGPPDVRVRPAIEGCSGTLGDNIFEEGDFGAGTANILTDDPGIAPGYSYTRNAPPSDGFYTISNNTGEWTSLYGTWLQIRDNSPDPNGYMMVVNASYTAGIFYEQTVDNLCANTLYEFSADVINLIRRNTTGHIRPNISFYINDELKFSSGDIPQDETWKTYGFTFVTAPNETTLKLSVRNNAPGGIGNDLALDNITFRACGPDGIITLASGSDKFICQDADTETLIAEVFDSPYPDEYYDWEVSIDEGRTYERIPGANGPAYTLTEFSAGRYYYRFALAGTPENLQNDKCRVYSLPKEIIVVPIVYDIVDTICSGGTYVTGGNTYTQTGFYVDNLISSIGCDSIVQLDLTVADDPNYRLDAAVTPPSCPGETDARLEILVTPAGYPPYQYYLDEGSPASSPLFTGLGAGRYTVGIIDRFGCSAEQVVTINDPDILQLDLGDDLTLSLGQQYDFQPNISAEGNLTFQWSPATGLSCTDCRRPTLTALETETYTLEVSAAAGCRVRDQITITVDKNYKVYLPNIFSPNGDGRNDRFTVFSDGARVAQVLHLRIFDRWGNQLFNRQNFAPDDETLGWDGRVQGQPAPNGVYIYQVEVAYVDNAVRVFSGDVSLAR
jgi:gliding motility-associated-like protein